MEIIERYLDQVLRNTFLTKREKSEWREEMAAHLHSSTDHYRSQGYSEEQAIERSIQRFGSISELRRTVTKETYGFNMRTIIGCALASFILFIVTLVGGLAANQYGVHNRYIEIMPIVLITVSALSICICLTRKRVDRLCLLSLPLLFALGYLQAYFQIFVDYWGEGLSFTMFEKLFFSGSYDISGRVEVMLIGDLFLFTQTLIIFAISKNRYISILPFVFSTMYTLVHMMMFTLYYTFFTSEQFSSSVTQGYGVFMNGNVQRWMEMGLNLVMGALVLVLLMLWGKWSGKRQLNLA
ncbi:permease prefix domain 1-containing protein [Paenibacillus sp. ALJ109b]|uniref:permease prefix domain 1-containing protein n=1 Tax=Paenibacillus sp. ALJ109b TaxID=2709068 RepID=UPI0013CF577B|nr:permease prefix domain 1-containing protein [Paenibacillus sp. ALJ109b]NEU62833.1 hypothetical protein [Paenibacillus sp. ALJ109b]